MDEIEKIVVITRKTQLDLVMRFNSKAQAWFYLEQSHVSFADYEQAKWNELCRHGCTVWKHSKEVVATTVSACGHLRKACQVGLPIR